MVKLNSNLKVVASGTAGSAGQDWSRPLRVTVCELTAEPAPPAPSRTSTDTDAESPAPLLAEPAKVVVEPAVTAEGGVTVGAGAVVSTRNCTAVLVVAPSRRVAVYVPSARAGEGPAVQLPAASDVLPTPTELPPPVRVTTTVTGTLATAPVPPKEGVLTFVGSVGALGIVTSARAEVGPTDEKGEVDGGRPRKGERFNSCSDDWGTQ